MGPGEGHPDHPGRRPDAKRVWQMATACESKRHFQNRHYRHQPLESKDVGDPTSPRIQPLHPVRCQTQLYRTVCVLPDGQYGRGEHPSLHGGYQLRLTSRKTPTSPRARYHRSAGLFGHAGLTAAKKMVRNLVQDRWSVPL